MFQDFMAEVSQLPQAWGIAGWVRDALSGDPDWRSFIVSAAIAIASLSLLKFLSFTVRRALSLAYRASTGIYRFVVPIPPPEAPPDPLVTALKSSLEDPEALWDPFKMTLTTENLQIVFGRHPDGSFYVGKAVTVHGNPTSVLEDLDGPELLWFNDEAVNVVRGIIQRETNARRLRTALQVVQPLKHFDPASTTHVADVKPYQPVINNTLRRLNS